MKKEWLIKTIALVIVVLFMVLTVTPSIGISNNLDDTTPPVTTISFDPPEPDGENGWYVGNVMVILNASDDDSGVNVTEYHIIGGTWQIYTEPFILVGDGKGIPIEFFSIDNAGNREEIKSALVDIDKTKPCVSLTYEVIGGNMFEGWDFCFTATATDDMSGMNRVEFYLNDKLQKTVYGPGPTYQWILHYQPVYGLKARGLIRNPEIKDEYVKFYAVIVIILAIKNFSGRIIPKAIAYDNAGNYDFDEIQQPSSMLTISPGLYIFENLTLPKDFVGFIGKSFIFARFYF